MFLPYQILPETAATAPVSANTRRYSIVSVFHHAFLKTRGSGDRLNDFRLAENYARYRSRSYELRIQLCSQSSVRAISRKAERISRGLRFIARERDLTFASSGDLAEIRYSVSYLFNFRVRDTSLCHEGNDCGARFHIADMEHNLSQNGGSTRESHADWLGVGWKGVMPKGGIRHPSFAGRFRACAHNPCRAPSAPSASADPSLFIIHVFYWTRRGQVDRMI